MVAEPWIVKMGNQVSSNLKHALSDKKQRPQQERQIIGILSFEVANVMSKIVNLHKSLTDNEVVKLKNEILKSEGVRTIVSSDEKQLLELALVEKLDDLNRVASVVSRLGKKCTIPALQGFEHVYGDIVSGAIGITELGFLVKDMEGMVRKMERYVNSTVSLYKEMEVMNELEVATKKFQQNQHEESRKAFEQKLTWQRQDVRHLKDVSLWNQTYDKVVELLGRTVCTVYARIYAVFGDCHSRDSSHMLISRSEIGFNGNSLRVKQEHKNRHSRPIERTVSVRTKSGLQKNGAKLFGPEDFNFACGMGPGRLFMECINLSSSSSKVDDDDDHMIYDDQRRQISSAVSVKSDNSNTTPLGSFVHRPINGDLLNRMRVQPKSRLLVSAPTNTVGGSALALHYANIIIIIEKLLLYPHLVGDEARDDLYQMLPTSLRKTLKSKLKSYVKDLAIYDAPLAHDWKDRLGAMLKWLAPLAHNMMRWQSERNFEQQQIVTRTNVLLLQTLYFADREKAEDAICQLLVGLNYICRYEQQQNALLDCASSFDFEDCMQWQLQLGASFHT